MAKIPILLLGATGYFGGSVLDRLLSHPNKETFDITVLVRSPEKASKLETFDVKSIVGSFEDTALLEQLAENAHVLFSTADSDNLDAVRAFLAGLKQRHAKTGERPILIHTSGTSVTAAGDASTKGLRITEKIFNDDDPDDIERSIPSTAYHRDVDLAIVNADKDDMVLALSTAIDVNVSIHIGYVFSYIVIPSTVWGTATHTLVDAGISNPRSIQVPWLIQASLDRGQAGVVGKGQALWPNVHIREQTDLFMILFDAVMADPSKVGHGRDGYYFGANGEHSWYDISKYIGKAMVKLGLSKSDEPTTFSNEELVKYWGSEDYGNNYGSNARVRAGHSRSLGWQPKLSTQDFLDSIDGEVESVIQRRRAEQEEERDKERKRHEYIKQITKDHVIQA